MDPEKPADLDLKFTKQEISGLKMARVNKTPDIINFK